MLRPLPLAAAAALVAIPTSTGIYYLATSSRGTGKQVEPINEDKTQELNTESQPLPEAPDTVLFTEAETSSSAESKKWMLEQDRSTKLTIAKSTISHIISSFDYSWIESHEEEREERFKIFVQETDDARDSFKDVINNYLKNQEDYNSKEIRDISKDLLGLSPSDLSSNDWSKLAKIRKYEVLAQISEDSEDDSTLQNPIGSETTEESIKQFCQDPSESNSHLGTHSPTRAEQEKTKEYRLFTYYSYCTTDSHYLNSKLKLNLSDSQLTSDQEETD